MNRLGFLAAAMSLALPLQAFAFGISQGQGNATVKWPNSNVGYTLNSSGTSDVSGGGLTQVRKAVASWNNVSCSNFNLTETGLSTSTDTLLTSNSTDGVNLLTWVEDSRWIYGQFVLGVTTPVFIGGDIQEADIAFNGYAASWGVNPSNFGPTDIESVAVHELGHFLGLQHVLNGEGSSPPPTMAPTILQNLQSQTLSPDDQSGACFLYPTGTYECNADCDCPAVVGGSGQEFNVGRFTCGSGGTCSGFSQGGGNNYPLGHTCAGNDCASSLYCQPTQFGSYCAQDCQSSANCPPGFDCYPFQSGGGTCLPDDLGQGGGGGGETCLADGSASGGFCGDGTCNINETSGSCPGDCGAAGFCGDGICDATETSSSCSADCGGAGFCGDGTCSGTETTISCTTDCGAAPFCGDGACNGSESSSNCPSDCGGTGVCGDGSCAGQENATNCPVDCGAAGVCGDGICSGPESGNGTCVADCGSAGFCGDGSCSGMETSTTCAADCNGGGCACDSTFDCDAGCACDPECAGECSCDTTFSCDFIPGTSDECPCDIECGGGCSAVIEQGNGNSTLLWLPLLLMPLVMRRRRR